MRPPQGQSVVDDGSRQVSLGQPANSRAPRSPATTISANSTRMLIVTNTCVEAICWVPVSMSPKALNAMLDRKTPSTISTASLPSLACAGGRCSHGANQFHPSKKQGKDRSAQRNGDRQAGREQRIGLVVFPAGVELGNILDVDVGDAQRGQAHVSHQDEDRGPDAVGFQPDVRQQEWHQANAPRHVHHARCNGGHTLLPNCRLTSSSGSAPRPGCPAPPRHPGRWPTQSP